MENHVGSTATRVVQRMCAVCLPHTCQDLLGLLQGDVLLVLTLAEDHRLQSFLVSSCLRRYMLSGHRTPLWHHQRQLHPNPCFQKRKGAVKERLENVSCKCCWDTTNKNKKKIIFLKDIVSHCPSCSQTARLKWSCSSLQCSNRRVPAEKIINYYYNQEFQTSQRNSTHL